MILIFLILISAVWAFYLVEALDDGLAVGEILIICNQYAKEGVNCQSLGHQLGNHHGKVLRLPSDGLCMHILGHAIGGVTKVF